MNTFVKGRMKKFDAATSLLVVSSYPDPKKGIRELNAVAWHTQKNVQSLARNDSKIIVLAEKLTNKVQCYKDGENILVLRIWEKGNPLSLFSLMRLIFSFSQVKKILFSFEFNVFGGMLPVLLLPLMLGMLRLRGMKILFEIHQVVLDIGTLSKHINISHPFILTLFNGALHCFYSLVGLLSQKVVVFESHLKERLSRVMDTNKIEVIPLSVKPHASMPKARARALLGLKKGDFVVMTFGFINWYKGSDWLVRTFQKNKHKNAHLILAGGESPTLKDEQHYKDFYGNVENICAQTNNITLTGFIPDEKVNVYFSAADLVVLPYRVFMSASGPFSLALAYKKPLLLSQKLASYFDTPDMDRALASSGLQKKDMLLTMSGNSFARSLQLVKKNMPKYQKFVNALALERNHQVIRDAYLRTMTFNAPFHKAPSLAFKFGDS